MIKNKCKKIISIVMLLIMMSTTFSVNVFAGGAPSQVSKTDNSLAKVCGPVNAEPDDEKTRDNNFESPEYESGSCGENVRYSINRSTNELVISGKGSMQDFQSYNPSPWYFRRIPAVRIEDDITRIGKGGFTDCRGFRDITIPDSVTEIGRMAFAGCKDLTTVTIGKGVKVIESLAFWECTDLTSVTYLGRSNPNCNNAFEGCCQLKEVKVPIDYEGDTFCGIKVVKGGI